MFKKLIEWLNPNQQQSSLENFIISKNPTSVAEVEYWTKWYDAHGVCRGF